MCERFKRLNKVNYKRKTKNMRGRRAKRHGGIICI